MDYVTEAIGLVDSTLPRDDSPEAWEALCADIDKIAAKLEPRATGDLRSFDVAVFNAEGGGELRATLRPRDFELPSGLDQVAGEMWVVIGGVDNRERAARILEAARIEYARSQFAGALLERAWFGFQWEGAREHLVSQNWIDADAIYRDPRPQHSFTASAAEGFRDWILNVSDAEGPVGYQGRHPSCLLDPRPTAAAMAAAITLSWIDEAICTPSNALCLLGEAMGSIRYVYPNANVYGSNLQERRHAEFRLHGMNGAEQRHAKNRELKAFALEKYRAKTWRSANEAANKLLPEVMAKGVELGTRLSESNGQRTLAEWFRGVDKESGTS